MNVAPRSSRRNVYTARPWSPLTACTVVSTFHSTPWRRSTSRPRMHPVEGGLAALVDPVRVVHLPRAVDRDADQEVVLLQERAPLVVQQGAVGLDRVEDPLARPRVLVFQLDGPAEKVQAHHGRLAALPGHDHLRHPRVRLHELADIGLLQPGGHPELTARVQHLLGQEEAVLAVQVAHRAGGLGHHVEGQRSARHGQHVRALRAGLGGGGLIGDRGLPTRGPAWPGPRARGSRRALR